MKVFTDEWVRKIVSRYGHLAEHKRPYIYFVATSEKLKELRSEIEECIAALSPEAQAKVIPRLQATRSFTHTYHELVVGRLLRQLGYLPEYEKDIDGLTPDWYVGEKGKMSAFVFEVFTANVSAERASAIRAVNNLWGWLRAIPVTGFALDITLNPRELTCDDKRAKQIARSVEGWLTRENPSIGARLDLDEVSFQIIHYNRKYSSLQLLGPGSGFMVNKEPVRINFKEKIHKYRRVLRDKKIPLVVGVVADFMTGVSFDSFVDLLFGSEAINYLHNEANKQAKDIKLVRLQDGLFHREPELSIAVWVNKEFGGDWRMKGIHNPNALHLLPAEVFHPRE